MDFNTMKSSVTPNEVEALRVIKEGQCTLDAHRAGKGGKNWNVRCKITQKEYPKLLSTPWEYVEGDRGFIARRCVKGTLTQLVRVPKGLPRPHNKSAVKFITEENGGSGVSFTLSAVPFKFSSVHARWALMSDGSLVVWWEWDGKQVKALEPAGNDTTEDAEDADVHPTYAAAAKRLAANPPGAFTVEEWGLILESLHVGCMPEDSSEESKRTAFATEALFNKLMGTGKDSDD